MDSFTDFAIILTGPEAKPLNDIEFVTTARTYQIAEMIANSMHSISP